MWRRVAGAHLQAVHPLEQASSTEFAQITPISLVSSKNVSNVFQYFINLDMCLWFISSYIHESSWIYGRAIRIRQLHYRHGGNVHRTTRDMALLLRNALMRGRAHIEGRQVGDVVSEFCSRQVTWPKRTISSPISIIRLEEFHGISMKLSRFPVCPGWWNVMTYYIPGLPSR